MKFHHTITIGFAVLLGSAIGAQTGPAYEFQTVTFTNSQPCEGPLSDVSGTHKSKVVSFNSSLAGQRFRIEGEVEQCGAWLPAGNSCNSAGFMQEDSEVACNTAVTMSCKKSEQYEANTLVRIDGWLGIRDSAPVSCRDLRCGEIGDGTNPGS